MSYSRLAHGIHLFLHFASFNIKSFGSKNCDIGKTIDEVKLTILGSGSKTTLSVEAGKDFLSKITSLQTAVVEE